MIWRPGDEEWAVAKWILCSLLLMSGFSCSRGDKSAAPDTYRPGESGIQSAGDLSRTPQLLWDVSLPRALSTIEGIVADVLIANVGMPSQSIYSDSIAVASEQESIIAFDTADGSELWSRVVSEILVTPPSVLAAVETSLQSISPTTGDVRWSVNGVGIIDRLLVSGVDENIVIAQSSDAHITAVNVENGESVWTTDGTLVSVGPSSVAVVTSSTLRLLDLRTGSERWATQLELGDAEEPYFEAIVASDALLLAENSSVGYPQTKVSGFELEDGERRFQIDIGAWSFLSVSACGESDWYNVNHQLVNARSGEVLRSAGNGYADCRDDRLAVVEVGAAGRLDVVLLLNERGSVEYELGGSELFAEDSYDWFDVRTGATHTAVTGWSQADSSGAVTFINRSGEVLAEVELAPARFSPYIVKDDVFVGDVIDLRSPGGGTVAAFSATTGARLWSLPHQHLQEVGCYVIGWDVDGLSLYVSC